MTNKTTVVLGKENFLIQCPFWDNHRAQEIPDKKWSKPNDGWLVPINKPNAKYIKSSYTKSELDESSFFKIEELTKISDITPFPEKYTFKNSPMKCQMEALNKSFPMEEFAYIMDMGTGKSFTAINFASAKAKSGEINAVLIVCDTGIKPVWRKEFELHCPIPYDLFIMEAGKHKKGFEFIKEPTDNLKILVIGVESLSTGPYAKKVAWDFVKKHMAYMVIDESSSIKNPQSKRTKTCWDLGAECEYRAILNGTPVDEGVENLFSQFRFLNWGIIGVKNYTLFKRKYCVMGGFEGRKIVGYENLEQLFKKIEPYIYTVKITDVEDMPDRIYETILVEPTIQQKKAFTDLASKLMTTSQGDKELEVETVLERMIRYQQIAGGYFPYDFTEEETSVLSKSDPKHGIIKIEGKNPKLEALADVLSKVSSERKIIIWARFSREREDIVKWFEENKQGKYVHLGAGLTSDEKYEMMDQFQTNSEITYFITSQQIGSKGLTLTAATMSIYYSNGFSYSQREQSERRPWRKGQKHSCLYVNLTMNHEIDRKINEALGRKKSVSDFVMEELSK